MTRRFGGDDDLAGARFEGADLSGARFRAVNLSGAKMVDADLSGADLSGLIGGLKVNGIEVAPLIAREMERRYPERKEIFAADPEGMRRAWSIIEDLWTQTIERAEALPEATLHQRVDEEWSFCETLRHMVFVVDGWISRVVLGASGHYSPIGMPPSFLTAVRQLGIDVDADPSFEEVLSVWRERMDVVRDLVGGVTAAELDRTCEPNEASGYPPSTEHKVIGCLWTTIEEAWQHAHFANRDLDVLEDA